VDNGSKIWSSSWNLTNVRHSATNENLADSATRTWHIFKAMIIIHTFSMAQFFYVTVPIKISINIIIIIDVGFSRRRWALEQYSLMLDRLLPESRKTPGPPLARSNSKTDIWAFVNKVEFSPLMVLLLVTDMPRERQTSVIFLPMKETLNIMSTLVVVYRRRNLCGFSNKTHRRLYFPQFLLMQSVLILKYTFLAKG